MWGLEDPFASPSLAFVSRATACYDDGMTKTSEQLTDRTGTVLAELHWADNGDSAEWCKIDDGTIVRHPDKHVTVRCQNPTTGRIRTYQMPNLVAAWFVLGLSAHRRNGIDGWAELAAMPGTAGRD